MAQVQTKNRPGELLEIAQPAESKGEIAYLSPPRLPYHPIIQERFGVDKAGWKTLVEAIFPLATNVDSVALALSYCRARNLDPFKRPVHIVPMWNSNLVVTDERGSTKKGGYVDTIWPGISELRTTAFRTGNYAGMDATEFGPTIEQEFEIEYENRDGSKTIKKIPVSFPEWCRITIHRELHGKFCAFVGPKVFWKEQYARRGRTDVPNDVWAKRPFGQIEKCAEAGALRRAFPEEIGNELTAEEMEGRAIDNLRDVTPRLSPPVPPAPPEPPKPPVQQIQSPSESATSEDEPGKMVWEDNPQGQSSQTPPTPPVPPVPPPAGNTGGADGTVAQREPRPMEAATASANESSGAAIPTDDLVFGAGLTDKERELLLRMHKAIGKVTDPALLEIEFNDIWLPQCETLRVQNEAQAIVRIHESRLGA